MSEFQTSQPNELETIDIQKTPEKKETKHGLVELIITPRIKEKYKDWIEHCGPNAVAVDGFVIEETVYNPDLPAANFNHHLEDAGKDATCKQIYDDLRLPSGKLQNFEKDGALFFRIFAEDCDEDVSTSIALIKMYCEDPNLLNNPRLEQLINIENVLDKTAGMNIPKETAEELLSQIRWIYEPYQTARRQGKISAMDSEQMAKIIDEIGRRIRLFADNQADKIAYNGEYETIGGGKNWSMVKEIGNDSRMEMVKQDIPAILSVEQIPLSEDKIQRYRYAFAVLSADTNLPLQKIYSSLNEQEKKYRKKQKYQTIKETDSWGGDNIRGGSPRQSHSLIPPEEIQDIINNILAEEEMKKQNPVQTGTGLV